MLTHALLITVSLVVSTLAHAREKRCEFIDDDGACEKRESVAEIQLVPKGTPYADARQSMLDHGYQARRMSSDLNRCIPELSGNCQSFPETVACKALAGADCEFALFTNGVAFLVRTTTDGRSGIQRVRYVRHLTIDEQAELEAEVTQSDVVRPDPKVAQPRPIEAKTRGKIDVPIVIGGDAKFDACVGGGHVKGLDPRGDGFLSVQSGPGGRPYREIDRLYNGSQVVICDERGPWLGVLYGPRSVDCGTGTPWPARMPYTGPCSYGWIHSRYVAVTSG